MATNPRHRTRKPRRTRSTSGPGDQALEDLKQDINIFKLHEGLEQLKATVVGLAGLNAIECVVQNGFETLINQMAPLRDLSTPRQLLGNYENARLAALRDSLAQPDWGSAGSLSVPEQRVPFIYENVVGAPLPPPYTPPYRTSDKDRP